MPGLPTKVEEEISDEYFVEDTELVSKETIKVIDFSFAGEELNLMDIYQDIMTVRKEKGLNCAPRELGTAEAFYEALVYELSKKEPNDALVIKFYTNVISNIKLASRKVLHAREEELECYTGVPKKIAVATPQEEKKEEIVQAVEEKPPEPVEEKPQPKVVEELLKITARIHFDFDKYNIKKEYIPILKEVAKTLKETDYLKVRIEGFTDIIGPKDYNERLALKRAKAVKEFLIKEGVPEEKIEIVGFGKERFIASNEDPIGRLTNRRVEFVVIKLEGAVPVEESKPKKSEKTDEVKRVQISLPSEGKTGPAQDLLKVALDVVASDLTDPQSKILAMSDQEERSKIEIRKEGLLLEVIPKAQTTLSCKKGKEKLGIPLEIHLSNESNKKIEEILKKAKMENAKFKMDALVCVYENSDPEVVVGNYLIIPKVSPKVPGGGLLGI